MTASFIDQRYLTLNIFRWWGGIKEEAPRYVGVPPANGVERPQENASAEIDVLNYFVDIAAVHPTPDGCMDSANLFNDSIFY
jgi:hypothetical protein